MQDAPGQFLFGLAVVVLILAALFLMLFSWMLSNEGKYAARLVTTGHVEFPANRIFFFEIYRRPTDYPTGGGYCSSDVADLIFPGESPREAHERFRALSNNDQVMLCRPVRVVAEGGRYAITLPDLVDPARVSEALLAAARGHPDLLRFVVPPEEYRVLGYQPGGHLPGLSALDEPREREVPQIVAAVSTVGALAEIRREGRVAVAYFTIRSKT